MPGHKVRAGFLRNYQSVFSREFSKTEVGHVSLQPCVDCWGNGRGYFRIGQFRMRGWFKLASAASADWSFSLRYHRDGAGRNDDAVYGYSQ